MESNLPAERRDAPLAEVDRRPPEGYESHAAQQPEQHQNLGVALLPLALIAFLILAFIAAAWTFLAAGKA
jgi:hypothetical protein